MRILWLAHRDLRHPRSGGAERAAFEITRGLARRGHSVLWVVGGAPGLPAREFQDGVELRRVPGPISEHALVPLFTHAAPRPDVVVEDLDHVVPWGSSRFTRAPRVAFFHHLHARTLAGQLPAPFDGVLRALERRYPRTLADATFVVTSEQSRGDLVALGVPIDRVEVVPLGVDAGRFRPGPRDDPPTVLYFGGLKPYKRPDHALRAFAALRSTGDAARLAVLGNGPLLAELKRLARALDVEASVEFAGRVNDDALAGWISRARLNLHCAVSEGWCLSALEAAAGGVPTAAYDVPGMRAVVRDGQTGSLSPDSDLASLIEGARRLLRGDASSISAACQELARSLTWERCAAGWESHLSLVTHRGS